MALDFPFSVNPFFIQLICFKNFTIMVS